LLEDARRARTKRDIERIVSEATREAYVGEHYHGTLSIPEARAVYVIATLRALGVDKVSEEYVDDALSAFGRVG
jgi:hypothetical protein